MRRMIGFVLAGVLVVGPLALGADVHAASSAAQALDTEVVPNAEWEIVGDLEEGAAGQGRAVALSQARALLTGYSEDPQRVYRYDQATGITRVADAPGPLDAHFAARLADGRVLVGGGGFDQDLRARCFIYDPARDRWSEAAPLPRPTYWLYVNPAVTLLDGRVMVAGGGTPEAAYFDPGVGVDLHLASRQVLLFNPQGTTVGPDGRRLTGAWRSGAPMPATHVFTHGPTFFLGAGIPLAAPYAAGRVGQQTVVLPDGRVLVVGGREYQPGLFYGVPFMDVYNPTKDSWQRMEEMPSVPGDGDGGYGGRGFPGVTVLRSGKVLIFGGTTWELIEHRTTTGVRFDASFGMGQRGSSLLFDPSTGGHTRVGDLNHARIGPLAAPWVEGGGAFAIGGSPVPHGGPLPDGEVYDPVARAWSLLPVEPNPTIGDFPRRDGVALTDGTVLTWSESATTVKRLHPDGVQD